MPSSGLRIFRNARDGRTRTVDFDDPDNLSRAFPDQPNCSVYVAIAFAHFPSFLPGQNRTDPGFVDNKSFHYVVRVVATISSYCLENGALGRKLAAGAASVVLRD